MSRTHAHRRRTYRELWNPRPFHLKHGAGMATADKAGRKWVVQAERIAQHREVYAVLRGVLDEDATSRAWVPMGGPNANR